MYKLISSDKELNGIIARIKRSLLRHGRPRAQDRPRVQGRPADTVEVREFGRNTVEISADAPERVGRSMDEHEVLPEEHFVAQNPETGYYIYRDREERRHYRYNIITNGIWKFTYPILADVIPSVDMNNEFSSNIIICKRQTAKKLVYWKTQNFVDKFNMEALNRANLHLVRKENMKSYANESIEKFYKEMKDYSIGTGIDIAIDVNDSEKEHDKLLHTIKYSKHPNMVAYSSMFKISREGLIHCQLIYSIVTLGNAKEIVYWQKSSKGKNKHTKFTDSKDFAKYGHWFKTTESCSQTSASGPVRNRGGNEPIRNVNIGLPDLPVGTVSMSMENAENAERAFGEQLYREHDGIRHNPPRVAPNEAALEEGQVREEEVQAMLREDIHREVAQAMGEDRYEVEVPAMRKVQSGRGIHTTIEDQDGEERPEEVQVRGEDRIIEDDF